MKEKVTCPNCGNANSGNYCSNCGQEHPLKHRTLGALMSELTGEFFNLDNSFYRSVRLLIVSPGRLTNEFVRGRRRSFISPFRLFIVSVFLFVFVVSAVLPRLAEAFPKSYQSMVEFGSVTVKRQDGGQLSAEEAEQYMNQANPLSEFGDYREISGQFRRALLYNLQFVLILMMPLLALMLALAFFRRKHMLFVDHMVFALHFHAFVFLYLTVVGLIPEFGIHSLLFLAGPFIYLVLAMRSSYGGRLWLLFIRCAGIFLVYSILTMFALLLVAYAQAFGIERLLGMQLHAS